MGKKGGPRPGAGRPEKKPEEILQRKQRQLRAFDDEWAIINQFASLVKHWDKEQCREAVVKLMQQSENK